MPEKMPAITHQDVTALDIDTELKPNQRLWLSLGMTPEAWTFPEHLEEIVTCTPPTLMKGHRGHSIEMLCYRLVGQGNATVKLLSLDILRDATRLPNRRLWIRK